MFTILLKTKVKNETKNLKIVQIVSQLDDTEIVSQLDDTALVQILFVSLKI